MQREDTRFRVRPGGSSLMLVLWSGSYLMGTAGFVTEGQCMVACSPSL